MAGKKKTIPAPSINKLETFNGEVENNDDQYSGMRMNDDDKIVSMTNAVKILPPNMIKNGRHAAENVRAICGFAVTEEMLDKVYANFKHEDF